MIINNYLDAQKKGDLTGGALTDEVADSSSSIYKPSRGAGAIKGLQQHFTPPEVASFVAHLLGKDQLTLDLTAGTGDMLSRFSHGFGIEIDRDHTLAANYDVIQGDAQHVVPIVRMTDIRFDRIAINPPFGLDDWHDEAHGGKVQSTTLALLWSMDLLKSFGYGAMLCGTGRLDREVMRHEASKNIVSIVDIQGPTFEGVTLPCSISFFARGSNIRFPNDPPRRHRVDTIHDLADRSLRFELANEISRATRVTYNYPPPPYQIKETKDAWRAIRAEVKRRQERAKADKPEDRYDVALAGKKLKVLPRPYAKLLLAKTGKLGQVETLNNQPITYFGQNKKQWQQLLEVETEGDITIDPAVKERLDEVLAEAELISTPLFPLKDQMRLGWLVDTDKILCTKTDPDRGFINGNYYSIQTRQKMIAEKEQRVHETKSGNQELRWFTLERKVLQISIAAEEGMGVQTFTESAQDVIYMMRHFEIPDPGCVATRYPEKVKKMRDLLDEIETEIKVNYATYNLEVLGETEFEPFGFKEFQKDHLSRLLTKGRGLLAHEQGLGKTLMTMTLAEAQIRLGAENKALFVAPQDLIPQWKREAQKFFGRELEVIRNPEEARKVRDHLQGGGTGWYITYFEALSLVGKSEDLLPEVPLSAKLYYKTTGTVAKGRYAGQKEFHIESLEDRLKAYKLVKKHRKAMSLPEPQKGATALPPLSEVVQHIELPTLANRTADSDDDRLEATTRHGCPRCVARARSTEELLEAENKGWKNLTCSSCGYVHRKRWHKPAYAYLTKCFMWGVVCVDELSQIRGDDSRRSKTVRALARGPHKYGGTGTPLSNYINDCFWGLWFALGNATPGFPYDYNGGKTKFEQDFCVLEHMSGAKGTDKENVRVRTKVKAMVTNVSQFWRLAQPGVSRCRKEHTGEPIVKRTWHPVQVPMGVAQKQMHSFWLFNFARYFEDMNPDHNLVKWGMVEQFEALLGQRWKLEYSATMPDSDDAIKTWNWIASTEEVRDDNGEKVQRERFPWRHEISNWTPANLKVLELAIKHAEQGEKVLIGSDLIATGHWISEKLNEKGVKAVHLTEEKSGKLATKNPAKRSKEVSEFTEGDASVMCAGIAAMKLGHNMDKASCVIVNGLPDSYEAIDQFIARVHRLTSKREVNVYVILPKGSLSETKWNLLKDKGGSSDLAFDGELSMQNEEEIDWKEVIAEMKQKGVKTTGDEVLEADVEAAWEDVTYTAPASLASLASLKPVQNSLQKPVHKPVEKPSLNLEALKKGDLDNKGRKVIATYDDPPPYKAREYAHKCGLIIYKPEPFGAWHFKDGSEEGKCENDICAYCDKRIVAQDLRDATSAKKKAERTKKAVARPSTQLDTSFSMFTEELEVNEDAVVLSLF